MLNLVLFGPPGAGKGTQSSKLIDKYQLVHLSTGDILRSEIANSTALGIAIKHPLATVAPSNFEGSSSANILVVGQPLRPAKTLIVRNY